MSSFHRHHRSDLVRIAFEAMVERGLAPVFSLAVQAQVDALTGPAQDDDPHIRDLRTLPWCSLDNDDSMDLDQLTVCEPLDHPDFRVRVAIADVDALVPKDSPVDAHARINTASVYTSAQVFPMLPTRLSNDLSSLNAHEDRLAIVTEFIVHRQGTVSHAKVYRARVRNQAKLAYDAVSAWLADQGPVPEAMAAVPEMAQQLRWQDQIAQTLRRRRHSEGSLELETLQPRAVFDGERVVGFAQQVQNRGRQLIEEFMIAVNTHTAQYLLQHGGASLRRVVRSPERWQRIAELARQHGESLPRQPDSKALEGFLARQHKADPLRFPDLSLLVVKLMGSGEYVVEQPHGEPIGHFGLALRDYTHSTAPNRRYPDLITQRMVKAAIRGERMPYAAAELQALALHCTAQEDAARKVERRLRKSEAALFLEGRVGEYFDAVVSGLNDSGVWVRVIAPPVEGKLVGHVPELAMGSRLRVRLTATNVERGFIDFTLAH
jgi:exoribonuclease-2